MIELITNVLLYVSSIFMLIGALGLFRFPCPYTRIHAATMVTVGGVCFSMLILAASMFWTLFMPRILIITAFTLFTSPVLSHAIVNSAYKLDIKPERLATNEMSKAMLKRLKTEEEEL